MCQGVKDSLCIVARTMSALHGPWDQKHANRISYVEWLQLGCRDGATIKSQICDHSRMSSSSNNLLRNKGWNLNMSTIYMQTNSNIIPDLLKTASSSPRHTHFTSVSLFFCYRFGSSALCFPRWTAGASATFLQCRIIWKAASFTRERTVLSQWL